VLAEQRFVPTSTAQEDSEDNMDGFSLTITGHEFVKDDEGRDALRVNYEFINKRETAIPTEKCTDRAFQNGEELQRGTIGGDDGRFPYPLRNGGGTDCWGVYLLQGSGPVTVTFTNIDRGANEEFLRETYQP
jgi:hypothetical protein